MSDVGLHGGGEAPAAAVIVSALPLAEGAGAQRPGAGDQSRGSGPSAGLLELIPPTTDPLEDLRECFNCVNTPYINSNIICM